MKVLIGFSGGVDSAVAAYLLKQQGHDVTGCFMRNWDALANNDYLGNPTLNDGQCPQEKDYDDAKAAAAILRIPLLRVDFVKEYWDKVFSYFLDEYKRGRTPNPDVYCNKYIKFDSFLEYAKEHGFEKIAMGHYAKKESYEGIEYIYKAFDKNKDQSYFLCQLNEEQIKSCLFPLGEITKEEVRKIAHELNLTSVMDKKDSTGVCFIGERNFRQFLNNYFPASKGKIIDIKSKTVVGEHQGTLYYTIGQRHGLNIGGSATLGSHGWFIVKKDVKNNILYVSSESDEALYCDEVELENLNFIGGPYKDGEAVNVKFRYRAVDIDCLLSFKEGKTFLKVQGQAKAVTPGQFAVIYQGERMIGSGIIHATYSKGVRTDI